MNKKFQHIRQDDFDTGTMVLERQVPGPKGNEKRNCKTALIQKDFVNVNATVTF